MLRASCFVLSALVVVACGDSSTSPSGGAGGGTPTAGAAPGGGNEGGAGGAATGGGPQGGSADGGNGAGPVGGNAPACDGDGDRVSLMGAGCCGAPDVCDCDDNDSNVFPGQEMFFDEPRPFEDDRILKWDYDCDGVATKQYPQAADGCGPLACVGTSTEFQGDNGDYFCGAPGTLIICAGIGLQCTVQGGATLACK